MEDPEYTTKAMPRRKNDHEISMPYFISIMNIAMLFLPLKTEKQNSLGN